MTAWEAVRRRFTVPGVIDEQAERRPDDTCLHVHDKRITCAELAERSVAAANALAERGVQAGDRVAVFMETAPEWLYAWFGVARLGAHTVPVNTAFRGDFLANQLRATDTKLVVAHEALVARLAAVAH